MPAATRLPSLAALLALAMLAAPALAQPRVVADIAPTHSIVARVMQGVHAPELLVPPAASPHGYALRPSQAAALQDADLVVWTSPALTPWLEGPLRALASDADLLLFAGIEGVALLAVREGGAYETDEHDHHDAHATEADEVRAAPASADAHLWLDPVNGARLAAAVAETLAAEDPANAARYRANAADFAAEMDALTAEIAALVAPVRGRSFVVFHDAYQYFEARFDVPAAGSIAVSDATPPSAARLDAIRDRIAEARVACVFAEPQFDPRLVASAAEGTAARGAALDPLGGQLEPGPALYPGLLRELAEHLAGCLRGDS